MVRVADDADELLELEPLRAELAEARANLARRTEELEQVLYIVSHDLREPVRMVSSFMSLLERRLATELDPESRQFIDFAIDGAARMNGMLDALLRYSRAGRTAGAPEPVDPGPIVDEAVAALRSAHPDLPIRVGRSDLPAVRCGRRELEIAVANVLSNGVVYNRSEIATVDVSGDAGSGRVRLRFADNGIGIPRESWADIFLPMRRLQAPGEFPGNGVGLAEARKALLPFGGVIEVLESGDEGTLFMIDLPEASDVVDLV